MLHLFEVKGSVGVLTRNLHLEVHKLQLVAAPEGDGVWYYVQGANIVWRDFCVWEERSCWRQRQNLGI